MKKTDSGGGIKPSARHLSMVGPNGADGTT